MKAQLGEDLIELGQQRQARLSMGGEQAQWRHWVAGQLNGDKHRWNGVGGNQHTILRQLRVGDAFHATQYRINKDHGRGDQQAGGVGHF